LRSLQGDEAALHDSIEHGQEIVCVESVPGEAEIIDVLIFGINKWKNCYYGLAWKLEVLWPARGGR